jgi:hypothetical protein
MKLRIMQLSPFSCHSLPLSPTYLPKHPILQDPQPMFFPPCDRQNCTSIWKYINSIALYVNAILFLDRKGKREYTGPNFCRLSDLFISIQNRQWMYKVTLSSVRKPSLQRKSNKYYIFWVCVCSLRYPACNAHAPYSHLWALCPYSVFPHNLINGTIFEKKVTEHKICVLISSTIFVWNIFFSKKNSMR